MICDSSISQIKAAILGVLLPGLLVTAGCNAFAPLEVQETYFCDLFENGICRDRRDDEHIYNVDVPLFKQKSWYDLGYHMYFHTRETPGLRLVFNRSLSREELELLEQNMHCSYELERDGEVHSGHLEGVRVDESGAWCFDYLGTMLVRFHKERETDDSRPRADWFPVRLRLQYASEKPALRGEREGLVIVRWPGAEGAQKP